MDIVRVNMVLDILVLEQFALLRLRLLQLSVDAVVCNSRMLSVHLNTVLDIPAAESLAFWLPLPLRLRSSLAAAAEFNTPMPIVPLCSVSDILAPASRAFWLRQHPLALHPLQAA